MGTSPISPLTSANEPELAALSEDLEPENVMERSDGTLLEIRNRLLFQMETNSISRHKLLYSEQY